MVKVRKSEERGQGRYGWLDTRYTFSFSDYYDPAHVHFRSLRVINEDFIAGGQGFGMHPHQDMEIVTYVVSGALRHRDSMGHTAVMRAGDVQRISAGTGILHSEVNESGSEPIHLLQIWILPDRKGVTPRYDEQSFASAAQGRLSLIASPTARDGSIPIHQDAEVYVGKLEAGTAIDHPTSAERGVWIQVISGALDVSGTRLDAGDGGAITGEASLRITAAGDAHFLLFDLK